jgi:hypothetical protein
LGDGRRSGAVTGDCRLLDAGRRFLLALDRWQIFDTDAQPHRRRWRCVDSERLCFGVERRPAGLSGAGLSGAGLAHGRKRSGLRDAAGEHTAQDAEH